MSTRTSARLAHKNAKEVQPANDISHDVSLFHDTIERDGSENGQQQAPPQKRRRTSAKQGKKISGPQGHFSGLVHILVEIFAEIMAYLMPVDILAVSRSNKSLRNLLMTRSSVHIWHAAMKNVPGLPPCPPGMSEPSYLALIFSKTCTLCGGIARAGLHEALLVRLCASCQDTSLIPLADVPKALAPFIHVTRRTPSASLNCVSTQFGPVRASIAPGRRNACKRYVLRESVAKLQVEYKNMLQSRNKSGLKAWETEKKQLVARRNEDSRVLAKVIDALERDEMRILNGAIDLHRSEIERRLGELGWTKEDMSFSLLSEHRRAYCELVEQPKPFTERNWIAIKPKLIPILETNRAQRIETQRLEHRHKRRVRLSELFLKIKEQTTPRLEIQVQLPGPLLQHQDSVATVRFAPSFPSWSRLLSEPFLPFLKNLQETDLTVEDMEARFEADRERIQDYIAEWKSSVQARFVDQLRQGLAIQVEPLQTTSIITNNGNPFYNLSDELKLLLRADSLFYEASDLPTACHARPETYGSIILKAGLAGPRYSLSLWRDLPSSTDLDKLFPYPEAQEVARMLLISIGRRNVSFLEMEAIGSHFGCGRCHEVNMSWDELVLHYIRHNTLYLRIQEESLQLANEGVIYNNIHSPEMQPTRPMIEVHSNSSVNEFVNVGARRLEVCQLCQKIQTIRGTIAVPKPEMTQHLLDVHGIVKPQVNEHYVTHTLLGEALQCDEYGFPLYDELML